MTTTKAGAFVASAMLTLAACAHYEPHPIDLSDTATQQFSRALDMARIAAIREKIAPEAPGIDVQSPDRLWLLAAILANDPKVATAQAAVVTAEARAKAERHVVAPTLTLTGEYANDPSTSSPWLIGGAVDFPLDMGGRRGARLRTADLDVTIARYNFAETLWSERMAARRALIDQFIAEQRITVDQELLELRDRQLAVAERRVKAGAASNADAEVVRLTRDAAARDLALAQSQLAQSDEALAAILGVPATALADKEWAWADFDTPVAPPMGAKNTDARIGAITARGDVLKALADYDRTDAAYRGEIAKQFPALTLSPGYTWERGLVKLPLSVGLALPPLDLNRHAIASASKARDEAGKHLEEVVAAASNAIDAALVEQGQAMSVLREIEKHDLPAATAAAKRADYRLQSGDIDRAEWANEQTALLEARRREIDALARAQAAQAALEDAMRKPLEGPEMLMTVSALEVVR